MGYYADFEKSCVNATTYPVNLLRTESWKHILDRYCQKLTDAESLQSESPKVFDDKYRSIFILDYSDILHCE